MFLLSLRRSLHALEFCRKMSDVYKLKPTVIEYSCLIDKRLWSLLTTWISGVWVSTKSHIHAPRKSISNIYVWFYLLLSIIVYLIYEHFIGLLFRKLKSLKIWYLHWKCWINGCKQFSWSKRYNILEVHRIKRIIKVWYWLSLLATQNSHNQYAQNDGIRCHVSNFKCVCLLFLNVFCCLTFFSSFSMFLSKSHNWGG